ncbi:hypothetical protein Lsai_1521 [Legionella sainthelensi]|uniref:Lipoprotein n=1 Tax=Legionella sainthelensi TaxID=28087 RepID=A0A0W0YMQ3_9GAMM|nr:hypothetical protein [Legionella sainthelensi]KTD57999.1 hypothetical protein Lsai_1521 [Legionella sainthelensi]VEH28375.1 Uncharacterised protein [Legionella sainthelensi]
MIKIIFSGGLLGIMLSFLVGCAPTATVIGTSYVPINYTYAPGYNPPQVVYPDVSTDTDTYESVIIIHK